MVLPKSIAVIGEGETEWFYFDSLRVSCRFPFKIAPDMPQHSDIPHMAKMAEQYVARDYDIVVCMVDMDRLLANNTEQETYRRIKAQSSSNIYWIETNPCTEFWFLLHFLPEMAVKHYRTCDDVVEELQKYMPGYEKTRRYFRKTRLYEYLRDNGNIDRAISYSAQLARLAESSPADRIAYSQMHRVLSLLCQWSGHNVDEDISLSTSSGQTGDVEAKIIEFLANSPDSDIKTISKAVGLRSSRTSDYLKRLIVAGLVECSDGWKKTYSMIRK